MKHFAIILLFTCACFAQPYEPIILLDVTGEIGDQLGFAMLLPVGDQNEDGKDEVLTWVSLDTWRTELRLFWGTDDGTTEYVQFGRVDSTELDYFWDDPRFTVAAGDVDGDSQADLFLDLARRTPQHTVEYCLVLFRGGSEFDTIPDWFGEWGNMQFTTNVGDYDGDGRDDVTRRPLNGNYFGFYRSDNPMPSVPTWTHTPSIEHMGFGDVNGDGFSDFGMSYVSNNVSQVDLFLGSPEADSLPGYIYQWGSIPQEFNKRFHFIGDVNGDGFDDLISEFISWFTGTEKRLYLGGNPIDFVEDDTFFHEAIPLRHIGLGDINNDGYDDFAVYGTPDDFGTEGFEIYLGGDPPALEPVYTLLSPFEGMNMPYRIGPAGDFNGDGIDDWMFSCYEGGERRGRI
ncbi:VCBS repeat-containing protein, partial [bacterium]|nr:VCBS repeat-containing protein [bacterium]